MNFDFSEEQQFIRDQARNFLSQECSVEAVRAVLDTDTPFDRGLWQKIVELGWTAMAIPEEYGGLGLGYLELCVIAEELGRVVAPVPFASSVYLATEAIKSFGSEEQKQCYLPRLAAGEHQWLWRLYQLGRGCFRGLWKPPLRRHLQLEHQRRPNVPYELL